MFTSAYDIGPIRPPSEAQSLLIRVSRNCPWNKCEFCGVYKGHKFEKKSVEDVKGDIDQAVDFYGDNAKLISRAFLQDADALLMKTDDLLDILKYLRAKFPSVKRITTYSRTPTLARKSVEELKQLGKAGISRIHSGLETGYEPLLKLMNKGCTPEQQIEAGCKVKEAGISLCEYIMPGLGGKAMSHEHALATAEVLNAIDPDFIRIRSTSVQPGTPLFGKIEAGEFEPLNDIETVEELRLLIENLDGITSKIVSDHMLNLLMEVRGTFPEDKQKMLDIIDRFLSLPDEEKNIFMVGVRLGIMRNLSHLQNNAARMQAEQVLQQVEDEYIKEKNGRTIFDFLRELFHGRI